MIRATHRASRPLLVSAVAILAVILARPGVAQSPSLVAAPTNGPLSDQVVSDDGRLTLYIPVGAAPVDVALGAIRVVTVVPSVAAYELRPLGTTFLAPVTVTWTLDPAGAPPATDGDLVWLGMALGDDPVAGPWAWLDDPHVSVVDGGYAVSGRLTRFGTLVVTESSTRIHGPEAIWGSGYAPGRGIPIDLDLTLVGLTPGKAHAAFSGDWRFAGGYPERISVTTTVAEADELAAVWQCRLPGATSLAMTFGVREDADAREPAIGLPGLPPASGSFAVSFRVACGTVNPKPNG